MWVDGRNFGDLDVLTRTVAAAGLDALVLPAMAADPQVKDALKVATAQTVKRGAFGAPTMLFGEEMFFEQDRLDFVKEALLAGR